MTRFDNFTEKISHIDFHENSDKLRTIESLRNLLIAEYNNNLEIGKPKKSITIPRTYNFGTGKDKQKSNE